MSKIFISYRRRDSLDVTGRLEDRLVTHFGREDIFRDIGTIDSGSDFPAEIKRALTDCQALLAVIGPNWLDIRSNRGERRLDDPADYVRREISEGLQQGKLVIPVLVRWAEPPPADVLPDELQPLASKQAIEVRSDRDFHADMDRLIRRLERKTGLAARSDSPRFQAGRIRPRGLRPFDEQSADFFLGLLPGPFDHHGLPENIRFWKTRIDETNSLRTFRVGLMYGPSGCGKSSLVKAGLLPRLGGHVKASYIEATANTTESQLLERLRSDCPQTPEKMTLSQFFAGQQHGASSDEHAKHLIVLDQFEQWLHANGDLESTELVEALRHCDGGRLQCLILVRDDFWTTTSRFMQALDIELSEGRTMAMVDLFDRRHARRVLENFGRAYERLPADPGDTMASQNRFLDRAIDELAKDERVVCVQLALFADMMKSREWTLTNLHKMGGAEGLVERFLDEQFSYASAPMPHRHHQEAARAILKALLPPIGTAIKGSRQSRAQLLEASGYSRRPRDFDTVIHILDDETRLITPVLADDRPSAAEENQDGSDSPSTNTCGTTRQEKVYQLTHDYLVPSLRSWLTRKQRETWRGRAQLRLEERSSQWNTNPENRYLPALWEYFNVSLFTSRKNWSDEQRAMMRRAAMVLGTQWLLVLVVLLVSAVGLQQWYTTFQKDQIAKSVNLLRKSEGLRARLLIDNLAEFPQRLVKNELHDQFSDAPEMERVPLAFALAKYGDARLGFLCERLSNASSDDVDNFCAAFEHDRDRALQKLKNCTEEATANRHWALKTRLATIALYLGDTSIAKTMLRAEREAGQSGFDPVQRTMFIEYFPKWCGSVENLVGVLQKSSDSSLQSGITLAVGGVHEPSVKAKNEWEVLLRDWYQNENDSGTHSATGWALRRWGTTLPKIKEENKTRDGFDWRVTKTGITMIRIREGEVQRSANHIAEENRNTADIDSDSGASNLKMDIEYLLGHLKEKENGKTRNPVRIDSDFWLSDCEITVDKFLEFLNDSDYDHESPDDLDAADLRVSYSSSDKMLNQAPVTGVSWRDAVMFCNWLSRQEGLDPCYEQKLVDKGGPDVAVDDRSSNWTLTDGANGYRLPTKDEWEYACRAGTSTPYAFGDDESLLDRYGVYVKNSDGGPAITGSRFCNAWGLFDMHGNIWEWCHNLYGTGTARVSCGGCWFDGVEYCRSVSCDGYAPDFRNKDKGFRVALGGRVPNSAVALHNVRSSSDQRMDSAWGEPITIGASSNVNIEDDRVTISVLRGPRDLSAEKNIMDAPRVMRRIRGNFAVQVRVSSNLRLRGEPALTDRPVFCSAGLLLCKSMTDYVRLDRAMYRLAEKYIDANPPLEEDYMNFDRRKSGFWNFNRNRPTVTEMGQRVYLRMERNGDVVSGSISADGYTWVHQQTLDISDFPQDLRIGVAVCSTSMAPIEATFDCFSVREK